MNATDPKVNAEFQRLSKIHEKDITALLEYIDSISIKKEGTFSEVNYDTEEKRKTYDKLNKKQKKSYDTLSKFRKKHFEYKFEEVEIPKSKKEIYIQEFLSQVKTPITISMIIDDKTVKSVLNAADIKRMFEFSINPFAEIGRTLFDEHVLSKLPEKDHIYYHIIDKEIR
jgi:hypothetical protein